MYLFPVLVSLSFVAFTACRMWEAAHHKDQVARGLMLPILPHAAWAVMERINYSVG